VSRLNGRYGVGLLGCIFVLPAARRFVLPCKTLLRVVLTAPARDVVIAADETAAIGTVSLNLGGRDY